MPYIRLCRHLDLYPTLPVRSQYSTEPETSSRTIIGSRGYSPPARSPVNFSRSHSRRTNHIVRSKTRPTDFPPRFRYFSHPLSPLLRLCQHLVCIHIYIYIHVHTHTHTRGNVVNRTGSRLPPEPVLSVISSHRFPLKTTETTAWRKGEETRSFPILFIKDRCSFAVSYERILLALITVHA